MGTIAVLLRIICAALPLMLSGHAFSASIDVVGSYGDLRLILRLKGDITKSDVTRVKELLSLSERTYDGVSIELDSPGGDVVAALDLGRLLRSHAAWTHVRDDDGSVCYSACVLVLAGGVFRIASAGKVGIHRPKFDERYFAGLSFDEAQQQYDNMAQGVSQYLVEMGVSEGLFRLMMQVSSSDVSLLSQPDLDRTALNGDDPAYDEWLRAKRVEKYGAEGNRQWEEYQKKSSDYFHGCLAAGQSLEVCAAETDKRFKAP